MTLPDPATYWDYIKVEPLLSLQGGLGDDDGKLADDEVLFIVVHQVYELWFKVALRDLTAARDLFKQPHVPDDALAGACRRLERLCVIFDLAAKHFPLIETMTTRDYLEFRDKLFPANGGQSPQFREIEILLGLDDSLRVPYVGGEDYEEILKGAGGASTWALERVLRRKRDLPTLRQAIDDWLYRTPIDGSPPSSEGDAEVVSAFIDAYLRAHRAAVDEQSAIATRGAEPDEARILRERYDNEARQAETFLRADDAPPDERDRRRRIRAAALYIEAYRELPLLAWPRQVLDLLVRLEQAFVVYRQRHARMAERIIGRRVGTGGSAGVDYLDEVALRYRVFRDLWAVRTLLVRRGHLPDPKNADFYGFRAGS